MRVAAIIGAGLIGRSWAVVFARAGWRVSITDLDQAACAAAPGLIAERLAGLARQGLATDPEGAAALVSAASSLAEAVEGADLVQECGPETLEAKRALFAEMDRLAPAGAILASSSSAIVASRYTDALAGRGRCLVAHPVNPPHLVPVVELCPAPWTSPETVARATAIYREIGQVPVVIKREIEGFVVNRLQGALLTEALRLVSDGTISAGDLDRTVKDGLGLRWALAGPFETIELNAPGGIADYAARFGPFYRRVAADAAPPEVWDDQCVTLVAADWGPGLSPQEAAERTGARDRRLGALLAFKMQHPAE